MNLTLKREYEYLIARAVRLGQKKLEGQLRQRYAELFSQEAD